MASHRKLKKRIGSVAGGITLLIVADQLTKAWAVANLRGHAGYVFWDDLIRVQYAENPGAFLSLGAGLSHDFRFWILTVAVGLFLLGCIAYLFFNSNIPRASTVGLTLVAGGGLSNLIDRTFQAQGRVVDFLNVGIGPVRTGIFNVADMAIMAGVVVLIFLTPSARQSSRRASRAV